jgi:nitrogen fixation/metabolism regulation signal transduction histidine kinase
MKYILGCTIAFGVILLVILASASADTVFFERRYGWLVAANLVVVCVLFVLLLIQFRELLHKLRARVFGSRLTFRLILLFSLIAVLPGVVIYTISVQFLFRSIESWFDVRVEAALEGGLRLGQQALGTLQDDLKRRAQILALELSALPPEARGAYLHRLRAQQGLQHANLLDRAGRSLWNSSEETALELPPRPSSTQLRRAAKTNGIADAEPVHGDEYSIRALAPINSLDLRDSQFLQVIQRVPIELSRSATSIEVGRQEFQKVSLLRGSLRRIYFLTLSLTLMLALFTAFAFAFVAGNRLSAPLSILAEGTKAVSRGDFSPRPSVGRDELRALVGSFNDMTQRLTEASEAEARSRQDLVRAKQHIESVMSNLSAGVLTLDADLRLSSANRGAQVILGGELDAELGVRLGEWSSLGHFARAVAEAFTASPDHPWKQQIEGPSSGQVLLARGSRLPQDSGAGFVLVFDDITELLHAQRAAAWGEVARRLAHEIKNPLTPIQLSAERMGERLAGKLQTVDAELLRRSVETIVREVAAMKQMVDAFRDYARLPSPILQAVDLNRLINDTAAMYDRAPAQLQLDLADALPPVLADPNQLRQVVHNLLQNAAEALIDRDDGRINVATRTEAGAGGQRVRLNVRDNGTGFAPETLARAFEPYVTSKPKGTGLGLAIVKKIVDEHGGTIQVENIQPHGASVSIFLPFAHAA